MVLWLLVVLGLLVRCCLGAVRVFWVFLEFAVLCGVGIIQILLPSRLIGGLASCVWFKICGVLSRLDSWVWVWLGFLCGWCLERWWVLAAILVVIVVCVV